MLVGPHRLRGISIRPIYGIAVAGMIPLVYGTAVGSTPPVSGIVVIRSITHIIATEPPQGH